jgi:hypothetical protein
LKKTDYAGLSHFEHYFRELKENYVVVGGFATIMLLDREIDDHGKATYDIDLVLLTTSSTQMAGKIKSYVREGEYTIQKGQQDEYQYFRFVDPKVNGFAKEIELFASEGYGIELDEDQRIIPIDPEEGLYSLSAIMLDKEYLEMIKNNIVNIDGIPCSNSQATMLLKMAAMYDLYHREDKKWKKHRRDILKLALLLTGEERIVLIGRMIEDMNFFVGHLDTLTSKKIKQIVSGVVSIDKDVVAGVLQQVFVAEEEK